MKGPANFVTAADRRAEETLYAEAQQGAAGLRLPRRGRRQPRGQPTRPTRWIVDPLDGTTNFLHGIPQFCISIGLERSGAIVAGVVYNPITDELFTAERGKGAFLNDKRMRVAARAQLIDAVVACGLPHHGRGDLELGIKELAAVQDKVAGLRRFGAAALDMAWVAAGRLDGYWERNVSPWDIAAGIILVREAGGYATDVDGGDEMFTKRSILVGQRDDAPRSCRSCSRPPAELEAAALFRHSAPARDRIAASCVALAQKPALLSPRACHNVATCFGDEKTTMAKDVDPFKVSSPQIFLVRMLIFLILCSLIVVVIHPADSDGV